MIDMYCVLGYTCSGCSSGFCVEQKGACTMKEDKTLTCRECGKEFVFTAAEQEFYEEKGFQHEPGRCPECRTARKARMNGNRGPREMYPAKCAACGCDTEVPFRPSMDRPVYCRDCYNKMK